MENHGNILANLCKWEATIDYTLSRKNNIKFDRIKKKNTAFYPTH